MRSCDVLIVGGGPAGSSCAKRLVDAGFHVIVVDKARFPRDKTCAGWITPAVLVALDIAPDAYAQGRVCQPINAFRTGIVGRSQVLNRYDEVVSYGIRRCEFDHFLLQACGAEVAEGIAVKSIVRDAGSWVINGKFRAPLLVGAGGHFCPVAKMLGADVGRGEQVVTAQEIEWELSESQRTRCRIEATTPELFFWQDLSGYGWCFRKGNYLNVGLGRENASKLSREVENFVAQLKAQGKIPEDTPTHFKGHAYALYGHVARRRLGDAVLLVGDAAALAYPSSGEGIRTAVESGLLAAQTIVAVRGDYRAETLDAYTERLHARFGFTPAGNSKPDSLRNLAARFVLTNHLATRYWLLERGFLHRQTPPLRA